MGKSIKYFQVCGRSLDGTRSRVIKEFEVFALAKFFVECDMDDTDCVINEVTKKFNGEIETSSKLMEKVKSGHDIVKKTMRKKEEEYESGIYPNLREAQKAGRMELKEFFEQFQEAYEKTAKIYRTWKETTTENKPPKRIVYYQVSGRAFNKSRIHFIKAFETYELAECFITSNTEYEECSISEITVNLNCEIKTSLTKEQRIKSGYEISTEIYTSKLEECNRGIYPDFRTAILAGEEEAKKIIGPSKRKYEELIESYKNQNDIDDKQINDSEGTQK